MLITIKSIDKDIVYKVVAVYTDPFQTDTAFDSDFDMFYRAEKSRSSSIPGSGLGLSICKYIVNAHGGEIYCKSSNRKGCEISFTLPLA